MAFSDSVGPAHDMPMTNLRITITQNQSVDYNSTNTYGTHVTMCKLNQHKWHLLGCQMAPSRWRQMPA